MGHGISATRERKVGVFNGDRVSTGDDEKFGSWMVMMVAEQCEYP